MIECVKPAESMSDTVFREYDIRGKVRKELVVEQVYDLVREVAFYFFKKNPLLKKVAVGMDGRTHSPAIKKEVCRAFLDSGIDVIDIGLCPSPALYFATHTLDIDGGIMITASHNPKEYNGLKICCGKELIHGDEIRQVANLFKNRKKVDTEKIGEYTSKSILNPYTDWLVDHFIHLKGMDLSVVFDCGNAVGGTVLPLLKEKLQWKNVDILYADIDGSYPHHTADPVVEKNMRDVKAHMALTKKDVGIGLDGDADRMAAMTSDGQLVIGDKLLAIFAQDIAPKNQQKSVVFDIKASSGLIELLNKIGMKPTITRTGHAFIKKSMKENNSILGGELSCHFFFNDRYFGYDDGIYASLRLCEILVRTGKTLQDLLVGFPKKYSSPEIRMPSAPELIQPAIRALADHFSTTKKAEVLTLDGVRATMPYGWGIVRGSHTQPVLSMRFEADSLDNLQKIKKDFVEVLIQFYGKEFVEQQIF